MGDLYYALPYRPNPTQPFDVPYMIGGGDSGGDSCSTGGGGSCFICQAGKVSELPNPGPDVACHASSSSYGGGSLLRAPFCAPKAPDGELPPPG